MSAIYFSSPTCQPCKVLKPVIDDLKEEFPDVNWTSINIKDDPEGIHQKYGVTQVPTVIVIGRDGSLQKHSGTVSATYYRMLRNVSSK